MLVGELQLAGVSAQTALRWPLKLLRTPGRGTELFDLAEDPGELRDLANADEEARVALEAALDAALGHDAQGVGLEAEAEAEEDVLTQSGQILELRMELRAPEQPKGWARFNRVVVARKDPDRDRIRIPLPPEGGVRIRSSGVRVRGPDGTPLVQGGSAIPLSALEVTAAPSVPAGREASCRVFHVRARGFQAEDVDSELEGRLRALGYLK